MGLVKDTILRVFEGNSHSRETREAAQALLQNCPVQAGRATLASGTVTVPCTLVTSTSAILVTAMASLSAAQDLYVSAVVPGVSFTVTDIAGTYAAAISYAVI